MESKNFLFKLLAIIALLIRTYFSYQSITYEIVYDDYAYVWILVLFLLIVILLQWFSVLYAEKYKGWAIVLFILGIVVSLGFFVYFNLYDLVTSVIYIIYAIECLVKISKHNRKKNIST
ncbi:hypothetical protein RJG79_04510 [Mycoplasmatota bacterium WC44]